MALSETILGKFFSEIRQKMEPVTKLLSNKYPDYFELSYADQSDIWTHLFKTHAPEVRLILQSEDTLIPHSKKPFSPDKLLFSHDDEGENDEFPCLPVQRDNCLADAWSFLEAASATATTLYLIELANCKLSKI